MAKTFPVGHVRINPNTFTTEVWDGSRWVDNSGVATIPKTFSHNINGGAIAANGITTTSFNGTSPRPTISATERELIFDFLKENMRVAEYIDDKGKVHTVQLEMRAGEGYVWENIRRVKTKDPL